MGVDGVTTDNCHPEAKLKDLLLCCTLLEEAPISVMRHSRACLHGCATQEAKAEVGAVRTAKLILWIKPCVPLRSTQATLY